MIKRNYLFEFLAVSCLILLAVLTGCSFFEGKSSASSLSSGYSSSSSGLLSSNSSSSNTSTIIGNWSANILGNADQITFYPDYVFSYQSGYGTWSQSGNTVTMVVDAGFYPGSFSAAVNGSSMVAIISGTTEMTAIQVSSVSYSHGYLEVINNSTNIIEINMWVGPDGLTNLLGTNIVIDPAKNNSTNNCVPANSSFTKIITVGTNNFYYSGYNSTNITDLPWVEVLAGQTNPIIVPSGWIYSSLTRDSIKADIKVQSLSK